MYTDETSQLETLVGVFHEMQDAGWNPSGDLLWGYFFVDSDVTKLKGLCARLKSLDYRFVDLFELASKNEVPSGQHMLHVERVEIHSPETLAQRNVALSQLALQSGIRDYDGWDAGPVTKPVEQ